MQTASEQIKISASMSADIEAKLGIWIPASEGWRCLYGSMVGLGKSAKDAALSIRLLQKAILDTRRILVFRDGTKNRPFKFKDIAHRK